VIVDPSDRTIEPAAPAKTPAAISSGRRRLAAIVASIALLWLFVLPEVAELDAMRSAIHAREARGIDSGAMFYTDLKLMDDVLARSKRFHREHPDALWVPDSSRSPTPR
jgi:hypothetical protein